MGGVDDGVVAVGDRQHGIQGPLCEGKLMPVKSGCVNAAFVIKSENGERPADDADRISGDELDDHVGHAHSLLREHWQAMAGLAGSRSIRSKVVFAKRPMVSSRAMRNLRQDSPMAAPSLPSAVGLVTLAEVP